MKFDHLASVRELDPGKLSFVLPVLPAAVADSTNEAYHSYGCDGFGGMLFDSRLDIIQHVFSFKW